MTTDHRPTRRRLAAVVAAGLLATGAIAAGALPASGDDLPPGTLTQPAGTITLALDGASGTVTYQPPGEGAPVVQPIAIGHQCVVVTSDQVLSFTATGGDVRLNESRMGVGGPSCGDPSRHVGAGQSLRIGLGSIFADTDVVVDTAELSLSYRQNGSLVATYDEGTPDASTQSFPGQPATVVAGTDVDFRTITMRTGAGQVQRGVGILGSAVFNLATVTEFAAAVDCGDQVSATFAGETQAADAALFVRGLNDDADTPEECDDIGVTLEIWDLGVFLNKSTVGLNTLEEESINATLEIVWAPQPNDMPLPAREINLNPPPPQGPGSPEWDAWLSDFEPVQWCNDWELVPDSDPPTITADHPATEAYPDGFPWCLISNDEVVVGGGMVQQTQLYHGSGDPFWK